MSIPNILQKVKMGLIKASLKDNKSTPTNCSHQTLVRSYDHYLLSLQHILSSLLTQKYTLKSNQYDTMIINTIVYGRKSHIVSVIRDQVVALIEIEFLKRFYNKIESTKRVKAYSEYYKNYLQFFCRPGFSDYYHNGVMVNHHERHAEYHYQTKIKDNNQRKGKNRNRNELKTIFSESIKLNLNMISMNSSRKAMNNDNNSLKERILTSFSNCSFISKDNPQIESKTIDQMLINEFQVGRAGMGADMLSSHNKPSKEGRQYQRNFNEFKTIQFREILDAKPNIHLDKSKLRTKKEQLKLMLNSITKNERGREFPNVLIKSIQIKSSASVQSIHNKQQEGIQHNINCLGHKDIKSSKPNLVLNHFNSASNIPKLSLDAFSNAKGRNKKKHVATSPKDLITTTFNQIKNKHSSSNSNNNSNHVINIKASLNITKKPQEKKVFVYDHHSNFINRQKANDVLLNTRNKKQMENLKLIPQISHKNILKSLGQKNKMSHTLQKTPSDKLDMLQVYYSQKEGLMRGLNKKRTDMYTQSNTNLLKFNSEIFSHLSSSCSMPKTNSLKIQKNSLKLKMNDNEK